MVPMRVPKLAMGSVGPGRWFTSNAALWVRLSMVGAPDVAQPWMPRAARDSEACLWHVSIEGGARRRGCGAGGVSECSNGPLRGQGSLRRHARAARETLGRG